LFSVFFDRDEDVLSESFKVQLQWQVQQFSDRATWVLKGYADRRGTDDANDDLAQRRVQQVADALIEFGVTRENIQTNALGESALFMSEDDAFALGMNRRVDLYVIDQGEQADTIPVQQWQSLELKPHRHLWSGWE
jgi:outer membrane protein OmpA-like peptidoglycan-associated protein